MFKLAQEKGISPWEVMLLIGFAVLLTALCLSRLWQRPASVFDRIFWSFFVLIPFLGPLLFVFFYCKNEESPFQNPEYQTPEWAVNFTPRALQAVDLAQKEANRLNHNFIGTEHLLLGLAKLGEGVAANVLRKMGVNLENVRAEIEKLVAVGLDQKMIGVVPFTPRVKKVFSLAAKEAKALNHTYVGTEHILLGLLREEHGLAARVLQNLGIHIERTRQEILKELDPNLGAEPIQIPDRASSPAQALGFSPHAQEVLRLSRTEADRFNHRFVGTEHLLLAILKLSQGRALSVRSDQKLIGNIRYTPRVKQVLSLATKEAQALNHRQVGTEHILLGLLREGDGVAARVLHQMGMTIDRTRQEIQKADFNGFVDGGLGI